MTKGLPGLTGSWLQAKNQQVDTGYVCISTLMELTLWYLSCQLAWETATTREQATREQSIREQSAPEKEKKKTHTKQNKTKADADAMCRLEHFSNCYPLFLRVLLLIRNQNSLSTGHHGHVYFFLPHWNSYFPKWTEEKVVFAMTFFALLPSLYFPTRSLGSFTLDWLNAFEVFARSNELIGCFFDFHALCDLSLWLIPSKRMKTKLHRLGGGGGGELGWVEGGRIRSLCARHSRSRKAVVNE